MAEINKKTTLHIYVGGVDVHQVEIRPGRRYHQAISEMSNLGGFTTNVGGENRFYPYARIDYFSIIEENAE
jgi:hypothetical protein